MAREFAPLPFWFTTVSRNALPPARIAPLGREITTPWHETEDGVVHYEDEAHAVAEWHQSLHADGSINCWVPTFKDPSVENVLLPEQLRQKISINFRKDAGDLVVAP